MNAKSDNERLLKRRGVLEISEDLLFKDVSFMLEAFGRLKFFPTSVEYLWHKRKFMMVGISFQFEVCSETEEAPLYVMKIQKNENGEILKVGAERAREVHWNWTPMD